MIKSSLRKLGVSEHKRANLVGSHFALAELSKYIIDNNLTVKNNDEIFDKAIELNIYNKNFKKETKISREIGYIKDVLLFINEDKKTGKITSTELLNQILKNSNITKHFPKNFFNFSWEEYCLLITTMMQQSEGTFTFISFLENFILNKQISFRNLIVNKKVFEEIRNIKNEKDVYKLISPGSGTPKTQPGAQKIFEIQKNLINLFSKIYINKEFENYYKEIYEQLKELYILKKYKTTYVSSLYFGSSLKKENKKINKLFKTNQIKKVISILKSTFNQNTISKNIVERIVAGSYNDYVSLIKTHFNSFPGIFIDKNDQFNIETEYLPLYQGILKNKTELINTYLLKNKFILPMEMLNLLKISSNITSTENDNFWNLWNFYNKDNLLKDLSLNFKNQKDAQEYLNNHKFLKRPCELPLFYEWIISISAFWAANRQKIEDRDELLINKFKNEIFTKVNPYFLPIWYAKGNGADSKIIFNDKKINFEPTLVTTRVSEHEKGIIRHLKYSDANMAYLIAPSIDSDTIDLIQTVSESPATDNKPIEAITTQEYIDKIVDPTY